MNYLAYANIVEYPLFCILPRNKNQQNREDLTMNNTYKYTCILIDNKFFIKNLQGF